MNAVRQLNSSDVDAFIALVKTRPQTFMGYSDDAFQESITVNIPIWLSNPLCFCMGVFDGAEMTGAMVAIESPYSPSWTWAYWVSKVGMIGTIFDKNSANPDEGIKTFRELDKLLFNEMETKRGLTRFFVAYPHISSSNALRSSKSADRFWTFMKRLNLFTSRYEIYEDALILANSLPKYEYQKQIIGSREWPMDLSIKMCVLIE